MQVKIIENGKGESAEHGVLQVISPTPLTIGEVVECDVVWESYDHNEGYQDWGVCEFPDRERNNGYKTRQVYIPLPAKDGEGKEEPHPLDGPYEQDEESDYIDAIIAHRKSHPENNTSPSQSLEELAMIKYPAKLTGIFDTNIDLRFGYLQGLIDQKSIDMGEDNKWISVKDSQKPNDDQWVQCCALIEGKYDNLLPAYGYSKKYNDFTAYGEAQQDDRVTHWTPLITPPTI